MVKQLFAGLFQIIIIIIIDIFPNRIYRALPVWDKIIEALEILPYVALKCHVDMELTLPDIFPNLTLK